MQVCVITTFLLQLRRSFTNGEEETFDAFSGIDDENDVNGVGDFPDFDHAEFDLPNNTYDIDAELSPNSTKVSLLCSV